MTTYISNTPCNLIDKPLEWGEQPRKTFDDDTVEMDITHCGICASDLFTLDSGWGKTDYPTIVGHEVCMCKRHWV